MTPSPLLSTSQLILFADSTMSEPKIRSDDPIADTNGEVNVDGDEKTKAAKKMMKKDGDGTKSKKRKADGKLRT